MALAGAGKCFLKGRFHQQICGRFTDSEHKAGPGGGREVFFERAVPSARIVDKLNVAG